VSKREDIAVAALVLLFQNIAALFIIIYSFSIFGVSGYLVLSYIALYVFFIYKLNNFGDKLITISTVFIVLLFIISLLFHFLLISRDISSILDFRVGISIVVFYIAAFSLRINYNTQLLANVVVFSAIIHAIIGIVHFNFLFSNIIFDQYDVITGNHYTVNPIGSVGHRERGIIGNPTAYAAVLMFGMFVIVSNAHKLSGYALFANRLFEIIAIIIMFVGIILSGSRLPFFFSILLLTSYFYMVLSNYRKLFLISLCLLLVASFLNYSMIGQNFSKFVDYDAQRLVKYTLGLETVFENIRNIFIGTERSLMTANRSFDGVKFTDNSFIMIMLYHGVVYAFFFILYLALILTHKLKHDYISLLLIMYFISTLFLTSAIVWDSYIITFFVTLRIITNNNYLASYQTQ